MPEQAPQQVNPWTALLRILTEPWDTFQRLGTYPAILPPYLLQMAARLLAAWMVLPLNLAAKAAANTGTMTEAQVALTERITTALTLAGPLIVPWVTGLLIAVVAAFVALFTGNGLPLRSYFGMAGYAWVPMTFSTLLTSFLASRIGSLAEAAAVSLSPAVFLPTGSSPYAIALLGMFNPFQIWYYILLALGFAALHRSHPAQGVPFAGVVFLLDMSLALIGASLASTSMLMQP